MLFRSKVDRLLTFLGVAGFIVGILLAPQVFPNASIDLSVPRQTISQQAEDYLEGHLSLAASADTVDASSPQPLSLDAYKSVQRFSHDRSASIYLQQTLGIPETKRLTDAENLPMYYWTLRWFKPSQEEEFSAALSLEGDVLRFNHTIPEVASGADLEEEEAQAIAEDYLQRDLNWNLDHWDLSDASSVQRPNRTDHTFNWKRSDLNAGEAELRLTVGIQGDQIDYYSHWIKTPDAFFREFREKRNKAGFFSNIAYLTGFYGPLSLAFLFFVVAIARHQINWRSGLPPAIIFFVVSMLARLNSLPLDKSYYSTTQNYTLFWVEAIYSNFFYAISASVPIYFLWLGGKQIAKRVWPQRDMILARSPNRLKVFTQAYWRGIMMAGLGMGFVVLFYAVSVYFFDSWTPMEVSYNNVLSTPFPFLSPLRNGILPAISEELRARFIGIGIVFLIARRWWLALLIPGSIWAFAHLGYVRDPIYMRGIELSIKAVFVYGLFFLCFGLLTTMVGHFVFNSLLGAGLLLKAQDPYLVGCGVFTIILLLAPLLPGLIQQWFHPEKLKAAYGKDSMEIVSATADDYTLLRRLPLVNFELESIFADGELLAGYEVVCLKSPDAIEGVAIASLGGDDASEVKSALVDMVYVSPRYRRCYYGTQLVEALTQRLQQRGVKHIQVRAAHDKTSERLFWANQNWKTVTRNLQLSV